MYKFFFALCFLFSGLSYAYYSDLNVCGERERIFKNALQEQMNIASVFEHVVHEDTEILFFGETHKQEKIQNLYSEWVRKLKKLRPDFNCILLEADPLTQKFIDDYLTEKSTFEDSINYVNNHPEVIDKNFKDLPAEFLAAAQTEDFMRAAKELKIHMFAIDEGLSFWSRNIEMMNRIENLIKNGDCKFSMMIVGKTHLFADEVFNGEVRNNSMLSLARVKNIKAKSINLISLTALMQTNSSEWNWHECSWNPPTVTMTNKPIAFLTSKMPLEILSPTSSKPSLGLIKGDASYVNPRWDQFDAAIIFP